METAKKQNPFVRFFTRRGMGQVITVTFGLILLCIFFAFLNENFMTTRNMSNLLRQIVPILLIGISQSFVLITGNIDLSIGSVVGMSCMISATLMTKGVNPILALLITMACSIAIGVLNGELVARCKLPPFIATLGTMTVARGIAQIVNNNRNTNDIGAAADWFRDFFYRGEFLGIYNCIWIAVVLWIIFNFILSKTRTGRHIYATTGQGTMDAGNSYELYAVAASVIGGVSTLGGQGLLLGTVIGASIWGVLQNGLQLAGAPVAIRNIVIGIIVVVSVLLDVIVRSGKFSRQSKKSNITANG